MPEQIRSCSLKVGIFCADYFLNKCALSSQLMGASLKVLAQSLEARGQAEAGQSGTRQVVQPDIAT